MDTKSFQQEEPVLKNQFTDDLSLQRVLKDKIPFDYQKPAFSHLQEVGEDACGKLFQWAKEAESQLPVLQNYDSWGKRRDEIRVCEAWKQFEKYAAEQGVVATGYERKQKEFSRVYQMALLYLFHPSSAIFSCPLAMTDGAARCLEVYGDENLKSRALKNLTSRDPRQFWTSGQWMTEKPGGSDVGLTETIAQKKGSDYLLFGNKWFTSAATSQMAMTLARPQGAESGSKGLSLFYLETRLPNAENNHFQIVRLKDKLGTKALPTAELELQGTVAQLVGGEGHGVRKIATLFNVTRVYNAVCAVGYMRRALALALDFSGKRKAFGKMIIDHPLHRATLMNLQTEHEGCLELIMHVALLMGKDETGVATADESALLRLLTTLAKLYTGKATGYVCSEVMEVFGGVGYCEDSGIPVILRNAQVLSIWEGTTNVLSLDVLRALAKECPLDVFVRDIQNRLQNVKSDLAAVVQQQLLELQKKFSQLSDKPDLLQAEARILSMKMTRIYVGALLLASSQKNPATEIYARHWILGH